jgi:hypothetical protein
VYHDPAEPVADPVGIFGAVIVSAIVVKLHTGPAVFPPHVFLATIFQ